MKITLAPEVFLDFSPHEMREPEPRSGEKSRKTSGTRVCENSANENAFVAKFKITSLMFSKQRVRKILQKQGKVPSPKATNEGLERDLLQQRKNRIESSSR